MEDKQIKTSQISIPLDWKEFEFPVQYIETDDMAYARRAFSVLNGKGKKKQSKYQMLRNAVYVVRIDKNTTDEEEVALEKKVSLAEKNECFPVEENSDLQKYPGTFTNIATFGSMTDDEVTLATKWHNTYFHYDPIHVGLFFIFKDLVREYDGSKMKLTDDMLKEIAGLLQNLFQGMEQFASSCKEAYGRWHKKHYARDKIQWDDEAYTSGILHLYKKFGGKGDIPRTLLDNFDDFIDFFDEDILDMADNSDENMLEYVAVPKKPNPMVKINPLKRGSGKVISLSDRVESLEKNRFWKKAMNKWDEDGFEFDITRMPKVAMVKLGDILIDKDIQRELDEKHCSKIVDPIKFDPALLQTLQCVKRSDGKFVSTDGQHTATVIAAVINHTNKDKVRLTVK